MKVKLEISAEADIKVDTDEEGNVVAIEFVPLFAGRNALAVLAYGVAKNDQGKVLDRFSLVVSGQHGRVSKRSRTRAVVAAVDNVDVVAPDESSEEEDDDAAEEDNGS